MLSYFSLWLFLLFFSDAHQPAPTTIFSTVHIFRSTCIDHRVYSVDDNYRLKFSECFATYHLHSALNLLKLFCLTWPWIPTALMHINSTESHDTSQSVKFQKWLLMSQTREFLCNSTKHSSQITFNELIINFKI